MFEINIQLEGLAEVQQQLKKAVAEIDGVTDQSLFIVASDLGEKSQALAPIESGDLGESLQVMKLGDKHYNVNYTAIDPETGYDYAVRQHEDLELRHDRTDGYIIRSGPRAGQTVNRVAGGQAKFLEQPFRENVDKYVQIIANAASTAIKNNDKGGK